MKKAVLAIAVMMLAVTSVQAQSDSASGREGKGGKYRGDPVARLTEALDLTDDQAVEVAVILEDSRAQHRAIQESVQPEHCAIRENTYNQLAAVLDEEQMARFEEMKDQKMGHGRRMGMPRFANCET